jgi:ATP-dependent DNA helicase RecG
LTLGEKDELVTNCDRLSTLKHSSNLPYAFTEHGAVMLAGVLRNPVLADLFHRAGYIERMGTGISRMRDLVARAGLPPVKFGFTAFFTATFARAKSDRFGHLGETFSVNFSVKFGIKRRRLARIVAIVEQVSSGTLPGAKQLAKQHGISLRTIYADLGFLRRHELLTREGSDKTGSYILTEQGRRTITELSQ